MTLHEARKHAYDVKAGQANPRLIWTGHYITAAFTLEKGRAVPHRRDNDRRLATTLRQYVDKGMGQSA